MYIVLLLEVMHGGDTKPGTAACMETSKSGYYIYLKESYRALAGASLSTSNFLKYEIQIYIIPVAGNCIYTATSGPKLIAPTSARLLRPWSREFRLRAN